MKTNDTIAAISTAVGSGGVAIIRVSGNQALLIAKKLTTLTTLEPRYAYFTDFYENNGEDILDQGLILYFQAPHSFTGEDSVEFHLHGSYFLAKKFLEQVLATGARMATAGEFTQRAFLNGKIDLTQAEAISEMIAADSNLSLQLAFKHLRGDIAEKITTINKELLLIISEIEASIDYPDEIDEPETEKVTINLQKIETELETLIASFAKGKMARNGVKIVLVGKPNVGKSSLMNLLLKDNRAIVTEIAGTTRDYLEEKIDINGIAATILDTAGIHQAKNHIEQLGIKRSKQQIEIADLCLMVVDPTQGITKEDHDLYQQIKNKPHLVVINKSDLEQEVALPWKTTTSIISSTTGAGEEKLLKLITDILALKEIDPSKRVYISSLRQKQKLEIANQDIKNALDDCKQDEFLDLIAIHLHHALEQLSEITKAEISDELIESIWANFCVGK